MRHRLIGGALLAAAYLLAAPTISQAQSFSGTGPFTGGEGGGFQAPVNTDPVVHLPTGSAGSAGFYTAFEFVMLNQTKSIGNQTIARRGFFDSDGSITGVPGAFIGTGTPALDTGNFSQGTWQPGFNLEIGYRFDDGTRLFANYMQVYDAHYSQGASLVPPGFAGPANLSDTFISSPVFNFNVAFAGVGNKVNGVNDFSVYGIWNGASQMDIKFTQRFQQLTFGLRVPMLQTDYSRSYGIAGGQFNWIFERFGWRAVSYDVDGNTFPQSAANYTNTLSQRMYGPLLGCGNEIFLANQFSLSLDLTGSVMLDVAKQRAKYKLGDDTVQSKWGREDFKLVPNANAAVNFWWYPVEGVQIRIGYQALTFFNTYYMDDPVGFNYGNIDPNYGTKAFRLIQGFNVGIGFFF